MKSLAAALLLAGCAMQGFAPLAAGSPPSAGDPARGRSIVIDRRVGLCTLCHGVPGERLHGNLGPDLDGVGARLTAAELRARIIDPARFNPDTLMPSYSRTDGLHRVAPRHAGRPLLDRQQIEDVVAYLATLQ